MNTSNPLEFAMVGLRVVAFCFSLAFGLFVALLLAPLRCLHYPLKMLGVHTNFMPLDWLQVAIGRMTMLVAGSEMTTSGRDLWQYPKYKGAAIVTYSHVSNL